MLRAYFDTNNVALIMNYKIISALSQLDKPVQ